MKLSNDSAVKSYGGSLGFFLINVSQFFFSTLSTFMIKRTFRTIPFPYVVSFIRTFFGLICLLLFNWCSLGLPHNFGWLIPPKKIFGWLLFASFVYSILAILVNLGFFVSSLDFLFIFRMSGILFHCILGVCFLGENLTRFGLVSIVVIFIGIIISVSDFQWSISKLSGYSQIIMMAVTILIEAVSSLIYKKAISVLLSIDEQHDFTILCFTCWEYFVSLFPLFVASKFRDRIMWSDISSLVSVDSFLNILFIAVVGQLATMLVLYLHKVTTLISLGILNQLKLVSTLVASHFIFGETNWDLRMLVGVLLLFSGGIMYTMSQSMHESQDEKTDEEALLENTKIFI